MAFTREEVLNRASNKTRLIGDLLNEYQNEKGFKDARYYSILCNAVKARILYKIVAGTLVELTTSELESIYYAVDSLEPCVNGGDYSYVPVARPSLASEENDNDTILTRYPNVYTLPVNSTTGDGQYTGTTLLYGPAIAVRVYVGAMPLIIGNGTKTFPVYFSNDLGVTARQLEDIAIGDRLYYNGTLVGADLVNGVHEITYVVDY